MKGSKIYWVVAIFFMLLMVLAFTFVLVMEMNRPENTSSELLNAKPYDEIKDLSINERYLGKKRMLIKADGASVRPEKIGFIENPFAKKLHMVKPDIFLYDESNKWISRIVADYATMDIPENNISFRQNVRLSTPDNQSLTTDKLSFLSGTGFIVIKDKFKLAAKGEVIEGSNLTADVGLKRLSR
ncbi:MAG: LPS export ABC transporter periplasmic protein LptC [Candidatus Omnitrophota bacterium]